MKIPSVSPHRIQRAVSSAQFHLDPSAMAVEAAPGRSLAGMDIDLVHRLGTINVAVSVLDRSTMKNQTIPWWVVDSMTIRLDVGPERLYSYHQYEVTVIG